MIRKILYLLIFSIFVISCSTESEQLITPEDNIPLATKGKQIFSIDLKEIKANKFSNKILNNLEPAFALISISDNVGNVILTREKIKVLKVDEKYVTDEITLDKGSYSLTEFIITDADNVVISVAPKENSVLAQFASSPLPFNFTVSADETKVTATENINAEGYTSVDFGYTGLSLTFPKNTDFFSLTVDDSNVLTIKTLNLKSITGATYLIDWGDGVIEEYVSTINDSGIENEISHTYTENGVYTITVSGSVEAIELLEFNSDDQENNWQSHITSINIENLTLLKSCELYSGNLTTLNTSENLVLETLSLGYNQISSLDFTNNPNLKTVWLRYNKLTELDVTQNPNLEVLWVTGNEISTLNLSQNSKLKVALVRENNLNNINFSNNLDLVRFDLSNNFISNIDISANLRFNRNQRRG